MFKGNNMNETISVADNIDISIWGLVLQADLVVRIVMLLLLMLSIFSWAIIFEKITKIKNLNKLASSFENTFWSGIKIDKIKDGIGITPSHPMETIFLAGIKEWELNTKNKGASLLDVQVLEQRLERTMASSLNKEMEILEKNILQGTTTHSNPRNKNTGNKGYSSRDLMIVIGDTLFLAPTPYRSRSREVEEVYGHKLNPDPCLNRSKDLRVRWKNLEVYGLTI